MTSSLPDLFLGRWQTLNTYLLGREGGREGGGRSGASLSSFCHVPPGAPSGGRQALLGVPGQAAFRGCFLQGFSLLQKATSPKVMPLAQHILWVGQGCHHSLY